MNDDVRLTAEERKALVARKEELEARRFNLDMDIMAINIQLYQGRDQEELERLRSKFVDHLPPIEQFLNG